MASDTQNISLDDAEALMRRALTSSGVRESSAKSVALALVAAEAEGQAGHGFSRLSDYVAQARSGKVAVGAVPRLSETGSASAVIDAEHGFAYPALELATEWGVARATETGCASVNVIRSHHCGALSIQVERISRGGCVGLMVANSPPAIAPWGAARPVFGTNPIAFAAPRRSAPPLVIDLSLSRVARGKVMHAKKSGQPIPPGWALDNAGQPTTDPAEALDGSMVPIGEAKGTALALMVEILAAVLAGANISPEVSSYFTAEGPPPGSGQFLLALRPPDEAFSDRLERLLGLVEGLDGARLPGHRRAEAIARARSRGLDVPSRYIDEARALATADV